MVWHEECPKINPQIYGQLIFDKTAKAVSLSREKIIFSTNGDGTIEYLCAKKERKKKSAFDPYLDAKLTQNVS